MSPGDVSESLMSTAFRLVLNGRVSVVETALSNSALSVHGLLEPRLLPPVIVQPADWLLTGRGVLDGLGYLMPLGHEKPSVSFAFPTMIRP
jgi:hypothetical protein